MTMLASASQLERVHAPTKAEFERDFVQRNQPVVITGVADQWPAFSKWNADYLKRVAGDSTVAVHFEERGDFQRWYTPDGHVDKKLTVGQFVDILTQPTPDRRYYMSEHDLSLVSRALLADVDATRYTSGEPKLFLGRDTCMPLHYHATTEAILCQLVGSKEVLLYSPDQWSLLYAHPWYSPAWMFSRVDGGQQVQAFTQGNAHLRLDLPPSAGFPKFKRAKPTVVLLQPGEILFIPVHWWHLTTAPGFQVNVSAFWPSHRSRYRFPQPGLQVLAHEWLSKLRKRRRRQPAGAYS